jgi:hypothetical protein
MQALRRGVQGARAASLVSHQLREAASQAAAGAASGGKAVVEKEFLVYRWCVTYAFGGS